MVLRGEKHQYAACHIGIDKEFEPDVIVQFAAGWSGRHGTYNAEQIHEYEEIGIAAYRSKGQLQYLL